MSAGANPTPLQGSKAVKTTVDALGRTVKPQHALTTSSPMTWRDTTYAYDVRGNQKTAVDPDLGSAEFTYDNLDQVSSGRDATGRPQHFKYDALGRKVAQRNDAADGRLVATWTFDTLPGGKGQPVAATRLDENGKAFVSAVTGYDSEYRPTGTKTVIPETPATTGLAGTYTYTNTYTRTGKVQSSTLPSTPGGLAAEKLITRYNADGAAVTMSGLSWYTADTVYSPFGQVLRTASGNAPYRVWSTSLYNQNTGRLKESIADRETKDHRVKALSYDYDVVGNINSITDTRPGGKIDRQCFKHDTLGQLTQAWSGKTCTGPVKDDVTACPDGDGYRQSYEFDTIGNRTKLTSHDLTNAALDDEYTYSYGVTVPGGGSLPPVTTKPHALTQVDAVTRDPGSTVTLQSTYGYDAAGNTTRRTIGGDTQTPEWDRHNKLTKAVSPGIPDHQQVRGRAQRQQRRRHGPDPVRLRRRTQPAVVLRRHHHLCPRRRRQPSHPGDRLQPDPLPGRVRDHREQGPHLRQGDRPHAHGHPVRPPRHRHHLHRPGRGPGDQQPEVRPVRQRPRRGPEQVARQAHLLGRGHR
ncbi:hypothetical protein OG594_43145 [Streptomyces sp. NBC_01214]|nr:hypothetical protein [Streptomyces sp. NBC_01214]MCX4808310.1 hypothetical protein [Streptomyces sp. NBC_01214]